MICENQESRQGMTVVEVARDDLGRFDAVLGRVEDVQHMEAIFSASNAMPSFFVSEVSTSTPCLSRLFCSSASATYRYRYLSLIAKGANLFRE